MFIEINPVLELFFGQKFEAFHSLQNVLWILDFESFFHIEGSCFDGEVLCSFLYVPNAVSTSWIGYNGIQLVFVIFLELS